VGTRRKLGWVAAPVTSPRVTVGIVLDNLPVYFRVHGVSLGAIGHSASSGAVVGEGLLVPARGPGGRAAQWIRGALVAMAAALPSSRAAGGARGLLLMYALFASRRRRRRRTRHRRLYDRAARARRGGGRDGVGVGLPAALIFAGGVLARSRVAPAAR